MPKKSAGSAKTKRATKAKPKKRKTQGKSGGIRVYKDSVELKRKRASDEIERLAKLFAYELPKDWNKKGGQGRPKRITQKDLRKLEVAFAYDCTVEEACVFAGVPVRTFYDFLEMQPGFSQTIEQLRNIPIVLSRKAVVETAHYNSGRAMDYLSRKRKDEFSNKLELDHNGQIKNTHELEPGTQSAINNIFGNFERKAEESESKENVIE